MMNSEFKLNQLKRLDTLQDDLALILSTTTLSFDLIDEIKRYYKVEMNAIYYSLGMEDKLIS